MSENKNQFKFFNGSLTTSQLSICEVTCQTIAVYLVEDMEDWTLPAPGEQLWFSPVGRCESPHHACHLPYTGKWITDQYSQGQ